MTMIQAKQSVGTMKNIEFEFEFDPNNRIHLKAFVDLLICMKWMGFGIEKDHNNLGDISVH